MVANPYLRRVYHSLEQDIPFEDVIERCRVWTPKLPLSQLPPNIVSPFREEAEVMLNELREHSLRVVLVPHPDPPNSGASLRAAEDHNPYWYSCLYEQDTQPRKRVFYKKKEHTKKPRRQRNVHRSDWKRKRTERSLKRLINGKDGRFNPQTRHQAYRYDFLLRELLLERLTEGYDINLHGHDYQRTGDLLVCTAFALEEHVREIRACRWPDQEFTGVSTDVPF